MIDAQPRLFSRQRDTFRNPNDGVRVIEAFDCFPVMTPDELAMRAGIAGEDAARYLLTLEHLGLVETDGESFWLNTVVELPGSSCRSAAR